MPTARGFAPSITVLSEQPEVLTPPDLTLTGLLDRFPGLAAAEAICLTGSTAAGWANPFSDVDVYAFADTTPELPVDDTMEMWETTDRSGLTCQHWMGRYGDSRVDLKIWPTDAPRQALAPYLTDPELEFFASSETVKDFVYRVSIALPLQGEEFFTAISKLIASSSYQRALGRLKKAGAENRLTDVAGMLRNGDSMSARLSALAAAESAADCALIMAGSLGHNPKWLLRRIQETPASGLTTQEYCSEVLEGPREGESEAECALRIADWVRRTIMRVEQTVLG